MPATIGVVTVDGRSELGVVAVAYASGDPRRVEEQPDLIDETARRPAMEQRLVVAVIGRAKPRGRREVTVLVRHHRDVDLAVDTVERLAVAGASGACRDARRCCGR